MKFKEDVETIVSSDVYYDLIDGGYIDPFEILENTEDAAAVCDAIAVINNFLEQAIASGIVEIG